MFKTKRRGVTVRGKRSSERKRFISLVMWLKSTVGLGNKMPTLHFNQSVLIQIKAMVIMNTIRSGIINSTPYGLGTVQRAVRASSQSNPYRDPM